MQWSHKGHEVILRNDDGIFVSKIDGKTSTHVTLAAAYERINHYVSVQKTKRASYRTPCVLMYRGTATYVWFIGIHAKSQKLRIRRTTEGKAEQIESWTTLYRVPEDKADFEKRIAAAEKAKRVVSDFNSWLSGYKIASTFTRGRTVEDLSVAEQTISNRLLGKE